MTDNDTPIRINVGGEEFRTFASTLSSQPSSSLSRLAAGSGPFAKLYDGSNRGYNSGATYFIDRSPDLFKHILEYLRTGELLVDANDRTLLRRLLAEAKYYELSELEERLSAMIWSEASVMKQFLASDSAASTGNGAWVHLSAKNMEQLHAKALSETRKQDNAPVFDDPYLVLATFVLRSIAKQAPNGMRFSPKGLLHLPLQLNARPWTCANCSRQYRHILSLEWRLLQSLHIIHQQDLPNDADLVLHNCNHSTYLGSDSNAQQCELDPLLLEQTFQSGGYRVKCSYRPVVLNDGVVSVAVDPLGDWQWNDGRNKYADRGAWFLIDFSSVLEVSD